jgi:hypothetical protein
MIDEIHVHASQEVAEKLGRHALSIAFWADILPSPPFAEWMTRVSELAAEASQRRSKADYNTGSIAWMEAYQLCALANYLKARVVFEVGTFIGISTHALALAECVHDVYTCDSSNDCCPATDKIRPHPFTGSIDMLNGLRKKGIKADLCFFDGHLKRVDADALPGLTHSGTVFAFHDYNHGPKIRLRPNGSTYTETLPRKGIGNVELLKPWLSHHVLIEPLKGNVLALLVPESML